MTSTIGIPIKLLNEAQVWTTVPTLQQSCSIDNVHGLTIYIEPRHNTRNYIWSGLPGQAY